MKPRHSAEQSTTTVNKSQALGKRGFAVLRDKVIAPKESVEAPVETSSPFPSIKMQEPVLVAKAPTIHVSEDPQEKFLCESCQ